MTKSSCAALGFLGGFILGAPLVAPLSIFLFERHLKREGLLEWMRR